MYTLHPEGCVKGAKMKGAGLYYNGRTDKWVQTSTLTGGNMLLEREIAAKRELGLWHFGRANFHLYILCLSVI